MISRSLNITDRYRGWGLLLLYCSAIFHSSSRSFDTPKLQIERSDLLLHFMAYGLPGMLFLNAFAPINRFNEQYLLSWFSATLYGLSDEFHQAFVPGRTPSIEDLAADSAGAMAFLFLIRLNLVREKAFP